MEDSPGKGVQPFSRREACVRVKRMGETGKERKSQTSEGGKTMGVDGGKKKKNQRMTVYSGVNKSHATSEVKL